MNNTTFLFKVPNFLSGMSSVLDIAGVNFKFNTSKTVEDADFMALTSDWLIIGKDLQGAMNEYDNLVLKRR